MTMTKPRSEWLPDPTLLTWTAQYTRYKFHHATNATYLTPLLIPQPRAIVERAVIGRWLIWHGLLTEFVTRELTLPPLEAMGMWRGLRAVAEQRSAPTSPLGTALNDIVANLARLSHVTPADRTLVGIATGRLLDGLARRYEWQHRAEQPAPEYVTKALISSTGVYGIIALLSALRGWRLAELLPNHPARKAMELVEHAAWSVQQPPSDAQSVIQVQTALQALANERHEFAHWMLNLIEGYRTWATL